MGQLEHQMDAIIALAFPNLKLEEIESWTLDKTLKYFSRAEWLLQMQGIPVEIQFADEEDDQGVPSIGEEIEES